MADQIFRIADQVVVIASLFLGAFIVAISAILAIALLLSGCSKKAVIPVTLLNVVLGAGFMYLVWNVFPASELTWITPGAIVVFYIAFSLFELISLINRPRGPKGRKKQAKPAAEFNSAAFSMLKLTETGKTSIIVCACIGTFLVFVRRQILGKPE